MRLWFARGSAVTLREQLVTQIVLAILSGDLRGGQRLPSTRELARRFRLHPNTVSAAYGELEEQQWVVFRHGSGVYVAESKPRAELPAAIALDRLVAELVRSARGLGVSMSAVRARLRHWCELQPPERFLLIEPDEELRRIVALEIGAAVAMPVESCALDEKSIAARSEGAIAVVMASKAKAARKLLGENAELLVLHASSVPKSLAGWLPAPRDVLVCVASRWEEFLRMGRTMLVAAGFDPETLLVRDARKANWQRGISAARAVVCDVATAKQVPKGMLAVTFPVVSEESVGELRKYEEFVRSPVLAKTGV
jgi:DNA-binding transcriptional regulator YhcF (GntR family)